MPLVAFTDIPEIDCRSPELGSMKPRVARPRLFPTPATVSSIPKTHDCFRDFAVSVNVSRHKPHGSHDYDYGVGDSR